MKHASLPLALLLGALACRTTIRAELAGAGPVAAPMSLAGTAAEAASRPTLPPRAAQEFDGLHNLYRLSDSILSGSEPGGPAALRRLRELGVRTVISVDGKAPDVEAAAALGLRYVHLPIQYGGIREDEMLGLAKTFRELEGPFYVHCFHGKHRGPAAAAVGRLVLDGVSRETAIGEMRQYCGTSDKYEGLFRTIAAGAIPSFEESRAFRFNFDGVRRPEGVVECMVAIARAHDHVADLQERDWVFDPEHPDVDARNEAQKLQQAFEAACEVDEVARGPADRRAWFEASRAESARLVAALEGVAGAGAASGSEARVSLAALGQLCSDCHSAYRN